MLPSLTETWRLRFRYLSAVLCGTTICLAPLAARSSFDLASTGATYEKRFAAEPAQRVWPNRQLAAVRDPFRPDPADNTVSSSPKAVSVATGMPNALPTVQGIVRGKRPFALVEEGGAIRVVGIGDALSGSRVISISESGVRLERGTVLPLSEPVP